MTGLFYTACCVVGLCLLALLYYLTRPLWAYVARRMFEGAYT